MQSDTERREGIEATHTIAVLGAKTRATDDAFEVPHHLRSVGDRCLLADHHRLFADAAAAGPA